MAIYFNATQYIKLVKYVCSFSGNSPSLFWSMICNVTHKRNASTSGSQDFYKIRADCLANNNLFEDPLFPADNRSLFLGSIKSPVYWKRPNEIVRDPRFFVDGASRFDVKQGRLSNCWFLSAVANLTLDSSLFFNVVLSDNSFVHDYAGVFHFRFWHFGKWVEVVVDDKLPTMDGKLVYVHSKTYHEFWSALLEKAYAKLNGSYRNLGSGYEIDAMVDFTGGITERYRLSMASPDLLSAIFTAFDKYSLIGVCIDAPRGSEEKVTPEGLVLGHCYSVTGAVNLDINNTGENTPLLRIRNPWGRIEWNGAWSDNSPEWALLSETQRHQLGLVFEDDGEFWMSYQDFVKNFSLVEICHLNPDSLIYGQRENVMAGQNKNPWFIDSITGMWVPGATAGGNPKDLNSFASNPQYGITLTNPDNSDGTCSVIIGLMQMWRRNRGLPSLRIGFVIYRIDNVSQPLGIWFFQNNRPVAHSHEFSGPVKSNAFSTYREVCNRFRLFPGVYVIVPATFHPQQEGEFLLRVFSTKSVYLTTLRG